MIELLCSCALWSASTCNNDYPRTDYIGTLIASVVNMHSKEQCAFICSTFHGCTCYSYDTVARICYLRYGCNIKAVNVYFTGGDCVGMRVTFSFAMRRLCVILVCVRTIRSRGESAPRCDMTHARCTMVVACPVHVRTFVADKWVVWWEHAREEKRPSRFAFFFERPFCGETCSGEGQ